MPPLPPPGRVLRPEALVFVSCIESFIHKQGWLSVCVALVSQPSGSETWPDATTLATVTGNEHLTFIPLPFLHIPCPPLRIASAAALAFAFMLLALLLPAALPALSHAIPCSPFHDRTTVLRSHHRIHSRPSTSPLPAALPALSHAIPCPSFHNCTPVLRSHQRIHSPPFTSPLPAALPALSRTIPCSPFHNRPQSLVTQAAKQQPSALKDTSPPCRNNHQPLSPHIPFLCLNTKTLIAFFSFF